MNYSKIRNSIRFLIVGAFLLGILTCQGAEFWLRTGTNTVTMPDGRSVIMWGFAQDSSAGSGDGVITVPGPQLSVAAGDSLVIHLQNTLPEPVSIFVPGQYTFDSMDPAFHGGGAYEGRVRSLTREAAAAGGTATYSWANVQAGTFLYHSGSHPSVQVQMGLYGALTVAAPGPQVYADVPFDSSVTLLFSEIDPEVHDAVGAGRFGPGPQFLAGDFTAATSLINSLSAGAPGSVAAFVWSQIPAADQAILMDSQQTVEKRVVTLVSDLNIILTGPCIYDPNLFPDGNLSPATLALLADAPTINYPQSGAAFNGNMVRLNRLLLQDGLAKAGIILQPVNRMTSTIRSYPQYFLVNGQPYTPGRLSINAGAAGSTILLRLLNAGMDAHVPTLNNGGDLQLIGEDGQQSPYPRFSSVVFMPALKTVDALWTPPSLGTYAVYDRRLGLVNGVQSPGGMLAYLSVTSPGPLTSPRILFPPASQSVFVGGSATFNVVAMHRGTLSYQWQKNATNIPGATNSTFTISSAAATDAANYRVLVTDTLDTASATTTSGSATLTVYQLPTITTPPAIQIVFAGSSATFSVVVTNGGTLTYHWQKDGSPIAGATYSSYAIASAGLTNAGSYQVVVTDTIGMSSASMPSATALLSVVTQPNPVTVVNGGLATFSVTPASSAILDYQWRRDGTAIEGATNSSYSFTANYMADDGHNYSVVVNGPGGPASSANALLRVTPVPPSISTQPASRTVPDFGTATFTVAAKGTTLTYQWQRRSGTSFSPIAGATSSSYSFNVRLPIDNGAVFRVVVGGALGRQVTSSNAVLTVTPVGPQILTQPANVTVNAGQPANLTVVAQATGALSYRWQKLNGSNWVNVVPGGGVSGTGSATLAFNANATGNPANAGGYRVVLASTGAGAGGATSATATLTIKVIPPTITTQPASRTVFAGSPATFSVTVSGSAPLNYQWQKNGVNLLGVSARNSNLKIGSASDIGKYTVVVTNMAGGVTSAPVMLNLRQVFTVNVPGGSGIMVPANGGTGGTVTGGMIVGGSASPYPSTNTIPAMPGTVKGVTITLKGLSHPRPNDIEALLVSPGGASSKSVLFMAGIGPAGITSDSSRVYNVELTFDDGAQSPAPLTKLTTGTYKPTKNKAVSEFPAASSVAPPAAAGFGTAMSNFNNIKRVSNINATLQIDDSIGATECS
jgi:hypothetical protein